MITELPGEVVEFGVFKGVSLIRGGPIVLGDYGTVAGETSEVDKFLDKNPSFIIKKD